MDRLPQLSVAIVAGLALCLSFPPFGWWYLAIAAFGLLAWVLTRESTTIAGGFGYGFLFGLVFYLPLLPWISGLVGAFPWIALSALEALFPALFGMLAVVVRRLPGWPLWFAGLWAAAEWLKSTVPFGGFPWGVVAFSQTDGPLLSIAQVGGAPLLSFAVALIGFSLAAITFEDREVVASRHHPERGAAARWCSRALHRRRPAADRADLAARPAVRMSARATTRRSPWPSSRATCRGSGWNSTPSAAPCSTTTSAKPLRLAEDVRAGRAPQPMFVIWPENSSRHRSAGQSGRRAEISQAAAAIDAPILVGGVVAAPGYSRTTRCRRTR